MNRQFDILFYQITYILFLQALSGKPMEHFDLKESVQTSMVVLEYDITDIALTDNPDFVKSWGIARVKCKEVLTLANALLILKKKYDISDFDFELMLQGFDEKDII